MCGFVCLWNIDDKTLAGGMIDKLAHRGPDDAHIATLPDAPDATGPTTETWVLRKACEDLLPAKLVWRKKAQFDEGSALSTRLPAPWPA